MIIACARLEPPPNPNTQKPISTLETAAQTPQHKTIAPGHTARVKAFNTADHTADTQTTQQACPWWILPGESRRQIAFFFQKPIPIIPFTFILRHFACVHNDVFPCSVTALSIYGMTRVNVFSACVLFHVTHPPASGMCGQSRVLQKSQNPDEMDDFWVDRCFVSRQTMPAFLEKKSGGGGGRRYNAAQERKQVHIDQDRYCLHIYGS